MNNLLESLIRIGYCIERARASSSTGLTRLYLINTIELVLEVLMNLIEFVQNMESVGEEVNDRF